MKARPILFNGAMVRALLDGAKTRTRRVMKPQMVYGDVCGLFQSWYLPTSETGGILWPNAKDQILAMCPYGQPGDKVVVASEIPGVSRDYCAGSDGIIYSRARGTYRPLKAHGNRNGYLCVTIMDGARKTTRAVHSLVCAAFYGPAPFDGAQVRHLDGNPERCEPVNLAWGTQAENWRDRRAHGNGIEGEKHHDAKLSDAERSHLRWAIEKGLCSQRHASRVLGMSQGAMGGAMAGGELSTMDQDIPSGRIPSILLEIVSVRVERLQDISKADARAEGITPEPVRQIEVFGASADERAEIYRRAAVYPYRHLWESINGADSWAANPWVWVIEFRRAQP